MTYLLIALVAIVFTSVVFYVQAILSAYNERKITEKFVEKMIYGSSLLGLSSLVLYMFFGFAPGLYYTMTMAAITGVFCIMIPKVKEAN